jgi:hypothetical protein
VRKRRFSLHTFHEGTLIDEVLIKVLFLLLRPFKSMYVYILIEENVNPSIQWNTVLEFVKTTIYTILYCFVFIGLALKSFLSTSRRKFSPDVCSRCSLFIYDNLSDIEDCLKRARSEEEIRIPFGVGIPGHVAQTKEIVNIKNAYEVRHHGLIPLLSFGLIAFHLNRINIF